jgi:O-antigen/teichoic acid export membrane protein
MSERPASVPPATSAGAPDSGVDSPKPSGLVVHYMRYSFANLFVLLAGLVSFPVLTRLLDNSEYGVLGYFSTWMMVAVAVSKLGAQHAVVRFYPYNEPERLEHFSTNLVLLPMALSVSLWAIVATILVGREWFGGADFSPVFWCVVLIVPLMVIASIVQMVVRASERSGVVMATKVVGRGLDLVLVLGLVILIERSAFAVYGGRVIAAALLLGYFVYWSWRHLRFSRQVIDLQAMKVALLYGLPLMANEFAFLLLSTIDRVLLKEITGDFATVGIYTIGYTLATHISLFMSSTLSEAFVPVANRLHGAGGDAAILALKDRVLLPMTYASIGVAAMVIAIGGDLLIALSGSGKAASAPVFVVVGTLMALYPMLDISSYGLLLRKRSMRVFAITFGAAALNIGANLVLIPIYGFMGAAWATVISYAALMTANCLWCPRGLLRFPRVRTVATAAACAVLLLAVIKGSDMFGVAGPWPRMFVAGGLFLALYALPIWLIDSRLRAALPNWRTAAA